MKKDCIRQGDLLFVPRTSNATYVINAEWKRKDGIIRQGEATGHHHRLAVLEDADVYQMGTGEPIVVVHNLLDKTHTTVVHEEHGPVELKSGVTYDVHVAKEFDIVEGQRYVVD